MKRNSPAAGHKKNAVVLTLVVAMILAAVSVVFAPPADAKKREAQDLLVFAFDYDDSDYSTDHRFLTLVEPDGSNERILATSHSVQGFDVSRKGTKIAYVVGDDTFDSPQNELWTINISGKKDKLVYTHEGTNALLTAPTWSKNSKQIYFATDAGDLGFGIHRYNLSTKKVDTNVVPNSIVPAVNRMAISPNGKFLLVVPHWSYQNDRNTTPFVFNLKQGTVTFLEERADRVVWTPDNQLISNASIYGFTNVDRASGESLSRIWDHGEIFIDSMSVSPDGQSIIFVEGGYRAIVSIRSSRTVEIPNVLDFQSPGNVEWITTKTNPTPNKCYEFVVTKTLNKRKKSWTGTAGGDVVQASKTNGVTLRLGDGHDVVCGSPGDDVIYGGNGNDSLIGQEGNDRIYGEAGNDLVWGGAGADELYGGSGDDFMSSDDDDTVVESGTGFDDCNNYISCP